MKKKEWILVFGVILLSCCLIAPITSVGALLPQIQTALGLSSGAAGLLTTIPLLVYAALSLLAGSIGRRWGADGEQIFFPKKNIPRRQRQRRPFAIRVSITLMATM